MFLEIVVMVIIGVVTGDNDKQYHRHNMVLGRPRVEKGTTPIPVSRDKVVERFVETLMSSEQYLKMIESVEKKLDNLDFTLHKRTDVILKYLSEVVQLSKAPQGTSLETSLRFLKSELDDLKLTLYELKDIDGKGKGETPMTDNVETRMSYLENGMKHVVAAVDEIATTLAAVKNRQPQPDVTFKSTTTGDSSNGDVASLISEFRRTLLEQRMKKPCDDEFVSRTRSERSQKYPSDCHEIQVQGFNVSGIYKIKPDDIEPFFALCDLTTAGGGWTVFQNRFDGTQEFFKSWLDYKHGFGNLATEFWLGLEKLHYLTNQKLYELRIELESQHGQEAYAGYSVFTIGPECEGYRISTLGTYYGSAGDSLCYHSGQKFSTYDVDNDEWKDGSCSNEHGGAWWYKECDKSNLNGKYVVQADEQARRQSMYWISFKGPNYPLVKTKMMIRPLPASRPNFLSDGSRKGSEIPRLIRPLSDTSPKTVKQSGNSYDKMNHGSYRYEDPFFSNNY